METQDTVAGWLGSFRKILPIAGIRNGLGAVLLLLSLGFVSLSGQVQVEVQNLAGISPGAIEQAGLIATRTFAVSGIQSHWMDMGSPEPLFRPDARRIRLRLVSSRFAFSGNPQSMGEALVSDGGGSLAVVYVDRVRAFAAKHRLPFATALAFAAAHEVGHLLRGDTVHTETGLMRACWNYRDADAMRGGLLAPDPDTSERMVEKLRSASSLNLARSTDGPATAVQEIALP